MAKRRAEDESDDAGSVDDISTPPKRARFNGDAKEHDGAKAGPANAGAKRAQKKKNSDDDEDEGGEDYGTGDAEAEKDKMIEEKYGDAVRASIEARSTVQGRIAQHGIIQSMEMHQFMCHKYLTFNFGPQINFIIGHNGSGKSAVLSAITVALGGKATSTGRGSGLKSFIREGQSVSEVTITLKNEGEEAYKPDTYGKSIQITRKFTKEGNSSYKIKSKDGKVISVKKEELAAICDHMNIQVDNPMNVLTQDAARQFLSASHPSDKYKFFLKGTQLSQLSEEYQTCLENIGKTSKILEQKQEALPDLKKQVKEATARYHDANKALEQKGKLEVLKKELAWAHVKAKEEEMRAKIEAVAKASRRLPKIQENFDKAQATFIEVSEKIVELEGKLGDLGDINHLNTRKKELQDQIKANRNKLTKIIENEKSMNNEIEQCKKKAAEYSNQIAKETEKLQEDKQAKREERERKINAAKKTLEDAEAKHRENNEELRQLEATRDRLNAEGKAAQDEHNRAKEQIEHCAKQIERCMAQAKDKLTPYGKDMNVVLDRIKRSKWFGEQPKGPIGQYVRLRDPKWADVMRAMLGSQMSSFTITDTRDRNQLKKILADTQNFNSNIIYSEVDLFNYSEGEPSPDMLTVLRALEISDPYILRVMINSNKIESTLLAHNRREGQDMTNRQHRGGLAWTMDRFIVRTYPDGGMNSQKMPGVNRGDQQLMFNQGDSASQIEHWKEEGKKADVEYITSQKTIDDLRAQLRECNQAGQTRHAQGKKLTQDFLNAKQAYNTVVEEHNEDVPVSIAALEDARDEMERNKASILDQFRDLQERKVAINAEQTPLMHDKEAVQAQINKHEEEVQAIKSEIEELAGPRVTAQNEVKFYGTKLKDEQQKVDDLDVIAKELQQEYEEWTAKAEQYCERVDNPRKPDEVERAVKSVQRALQDREREAGATVEDLQLALLRATANYETAKKDLQDMVQLNNMLKRSLQQRLARWYEFRRHIALRTKLQFTYHLSVRGYFGKVLFDHTNETLQLKVQTDDAASTQSMDKDPRSLSGGEKSFSTICLLLSLWEAIGCPIRCLDEFDVFMDAVNRRISMKMMIDTANSSDSKQYILITPQDMSTVALGPTVRVNRMPDPERGQTTLPI